MILFDDRPTRFIDSRICVCQLGPSQMDRRSAGSRELVQNVRGGWWWVLATDLNAKLPAGDKHAERSRVISALLLEQGIERRRRPDLRDQCRRQGLWGGATGEHGVTPHECRYQLHGMTWIAAPVGENKWMGQQWMETRTTGFRLCPSQPNKGISIRDTVRASLRTIAVPVSTNLAKMSPTGVCSSVGKFHLTLPVSCRLIFSSSRRRLRRGREEERVDGGSV